MLKENVNTSSCSPQMYVWGLSCLGEYSRLSANKSQRPKCGFVQFVCFSAFSPTARDCDLCTYCTEWIVWGMVHQQKNTFSSTLGYLRICRNLKAILWFLQLLMSSSMLAPPVRYFAFQSLLAVSDLWATCFSQTTEAQKNQSQNFHNIMFLKCFPWSLEEAFSQHRCWIKQRARGVVEYV